MRSLIAISAAALMLSCLISAGEEHVNIDDVDLSDPNYVPKTAVDADVAHRAEYAIVAQIVFQSKREAANGLADIRQGYKDFEKVAEEQNRRASVYQQDAKSGETGLVRYEELEPAVAKIAFDVRIPVTKSAEQLHGPVCVSSHECIIFSVFNRYRHGFFSRSWYEVEEWARDNGRKFNELLDDIARDDTAKYAAFSIWPDEEVEMMKVHLSEVRQDMNRVGKKDPTAEPEELNAADNFNKKNPDMTTHNQMMDERAEVISKVPKDIIDAHPEIYALDVEDIIEQGWITDEEVIEKYRGVLEVRHEKRRASGTKKDRTFHNGQPLGTPETDEELLAAQLGDGEELKADAPAGDSWDDGDF